MSNASFTPSHAGGGQILTSEAMRLMVVGKAEEVKATAEAFAAGIDGPANPTHYRDQFSVESTTHGGLRQDRAEASVVNDDEQALAMEFGIPGRPNYPKRRILGHALDSLR